MTWPNFSEDRSLQRTTVQPKCGSRPTTKLTTYSTLEMGTRSSTEFFKLQLCLHTILTSQQEKSVQVIPGTAAITREIFRELLLTVQENLLQAQ
jgi:hypothetical protein